MCGITPHDIAILCENSWHGGREYTPQECGNLTLDQIYFLLCDRKNYRRSAERVRSKPALEATVIADAEGYIAGRDVDGNPIKAKILGKSKASRLAEEELIRLREAKQRNQSGHRKKR